MANAKTLAKPAITFEQSLIEYLDNADAQVKSEEINKERRAIDALFFFNGCIQNWKTSGKVTLLAKLIERSEFNAQMRVMCGHLILNVSITGRGKKLTIVCADDTGKKQKPQWVGPIVTTLVELASPSLALRIDDSEIKEVFGIEMGDGEKLTRAIKAIASLKDRKIDGVELCNLRDKNGVHMLSKSVRDALDQIAMLVMPENTGNITS